MTARTAAKASASLSPSVRRRGSDGIGSCIGLAQGTLRLRALPRPPSWVRVRFVGLWILLVAVYAATLGIPAQPGMDYAGTAPHPLLAAERLGPAGKVDPPNEYGKGA